MRAFFIHSCDFYSFLSRRTGSLPLHELDRRHGNSLDRLPVCHRANTDTPPCAEIHTNEQIWLPSLTRLACICKVGGNRSCQRKYLNTGGTPQKGNLNILCTLCDIVSSHFKMALMLLAASNSPQHQLRIKRLPLTCKSTGRRSSFFYSLSPFFLSSHLQPALYGPCSPPLVSFPLRNDIVQDKLLGLSSQQWEVQVCAGFEFQRCTSVPLERAWFRCRGTVCGRGCVCVIQALVCP